MKLKRLFTAVLSTALALSLCAMPAMAADSAAAAMPKTSTSTIDKTRKALSPSISGHWIVAEMQVLPVMAKQWRVRRGQH